MKQEKLNKKLDKLTEYAYKKILNTYWGDDDIELKHYNAANEFIYHPPSRIKKELKKWNNFLERLLKDIPKMRSLRKDIVKLLEDIK